MPVRWVTLLILLVCPAFNVHEGGTYCLAYASRHQLLFSGGKKGDICKFPGYLSCAHLTPGLRKAFTICDSAPFSILYRRIACL